MSIQYILLKISILLLLSIIPPSDTYNYITGKSCQVSHLNICYQLTEGNIDAGTCAVSSGELTNKTCLEMGFLTGSCCMRHDCFYTTQESCELFEGVWSEGYACECDPKSSCCLGDSCTEQYDEMQCVREGGVFLENRTCYSSNCLFLSNPEGSCCDDSQRRCYQSLEMHCKGEWIENTTCEERGCFPREDLPTTENSTQPGRCCGNRCYDIDVSDCNEYLYYEHGYQCTTYYPCEPRGICVYSNLCTDDTTPIICRSLGGTWKEGGRCGSGVVGKCSNGDSCNDLPEDLCLYDFDNSSSCQYVPYGACCSNLYGTCFESSNTGCSIVNGGGIFYPDQSCDEVPCGKESCCVHDICLDIEELLCNYVSDGLYRYGQECSASGACVDSIEYDNDEIEIAYPVKLTNISIQTKQSSGNFTSFSMSQSTITLNKNTNFVFDTLEISYSLLNIDLSSTIEIRGCLTMSSSTVTLGLTSNDLSALRDNPNNEIVLFKYSCIEGDANEYSVTVDNEPNECVYIEGRGYSISLFYVQDCGLSRTEDTNLQNSGTIIRMLTVVSAILLAL
eukprot:TRINITY_DN1400_c0_g1_i1.p1 TRINITY_DN1400_c0_g1~~TRINITY_DN1400_c0_g1_i1.p1  ORF type:complete len:562 (-),score=91.61 TRINITY_DN1400_c0_g1_i1:187-1872(-)